MRYGGPNETQGAIVALQEVLADAAASGASLHVVHITSTCLRQTNACLQMIEGARKTGLDVTTEAYPYTATATRIDSAIYDEGWQERFGITYKDLQWVETGERLTKESFERYRRSANTVIGHSIPEEISTLAVANPEVIVASDGRLAEGKGHPRSAGTYARVLGFYVREKKAIGLMEAIRKMTLLPAQRLEKFAPQMQKKGRIKVGCDADLTIFDREKVIDRATFEKPAQFSDGIIHVMVNGVLVVRDGKIVEGLKPGIAIQRDSN